jgi:arabinose-5-phosphate isomerase
MNSPADDAAETGGVDVRTVAARVLALEARALADFAAAPPPRLAEAVALIAGLAGRVIVTGVGKSGHVGRKIAATLASTGTPASFVHPTEASHGDLGMIGRDDAVLALSKSGELKEASDLLHYCRRFGIKVIAITARAESSLARAADIVLALPDAPEACGETSAPTTSTTLQIALGDALAVALLESRGFTAADFKVFHPGGKLGALLKTVGDLMHAGDEVPLAAAATPMADTLLIMTQKRFGCVGVVDAQGCLSGIVTDGDLRRNMGANLLARSAGEVMTRAPRTAHVRMLASQALKLMNDTRITALFVVDEDMKPVGIIHVHDLLRAGVM